MKVKTTTIEHKGKIITSQNGLHIVKIINEKKQSNKRRDIKYRRGIQSKLNKKKHLKILSSSLVTEIYKKEKVIS